MVHDNYLKNNNKNHLSNLQFNCSIRKSINLFVSLQRYASTDASTEIAATVVAAANPDYSISHVADYAV
jgi:uncharacterized protein YeeX (DUF496 family)